MKNATIAGLALILILVFIVPGVGQPASSLNWYPFKKGLALGNSEGKKIFIHFSADWCRYCLKMERNTFRNPAVVAYLNDNFIAIKVDADREQKLADLFGVKSLPANWFISEKGENLGHRQGYIPPEAFIKILKRVYRQ